MLLAAVESSDGKWASWPSWMEIELFGGLVVGGVIAIVAFLVLGLFALFLIGRPRPPKPSAEEWLVENGFGDLLARYKETKTAYFETRRWESQENGLWVYHNTDLDTRLENTRLSIELYSRDLELIRLFLEARADLIRKGDFQSLHLETAEYVDSPEGVDCRNDWIALFQQDKQKLEQRRERELEAKRSRDQRHARSEHWNSLRKQELEQRPEQELEATKRSRDQRHARSQHRNSLRKQKLEQRPERGLEVEGPRDGQRSRPQKKLKRRKQHIPKRLRYQIFEKDKFCCVSCGRGPRTHRGLVLHVDHIIPESKGGRTSPNNLQTMCQDCNEGKGNRFSTDLRKPSV